MDRRQYEVLHSALINIGKRQTEMAGDILMLTSVVMALNDKTLVISDVDKRLKELDVEIKNVKDEVIA